MLDHGRRLRVVHDHEVVVVLELLRVQRVVAAEDLLLFGRQSLRIALHRVVDRLRDPEELVGAGDDPPLDVEAGVFHQRDQRVVDLRDAATERGRREMGDTLAGERLREPADLVHETAGRNGCVVAERLLSDVDELEHGCGGGGRGVRAYLLIGQELDEPQPGAAVVTRADLDLVCERADDLDPETALVELSVLAVHGALRVETRPGVADLDHEPVRLELVEDLDLAFAAVGVRVPDGVRAGLGQRELQVVKRLVRERPDPGDRSQREPPERDVFGLRRDREAN